MPKNKKPRKKRQYRPASINCFNPSDIEDIKQRLNRVELVALLKLGKGDATLDELREMRDLMNAVVFATIHRETASDEESQESIKFLIETGAKLAKLVNGTPPGKRYVCTADQLKSILLAMATCTEFINRSFEECPSTFLMEFNASLVCRDAVIGTQRFSVTKKIVDAAFLEAIALNRIKHPVLYEREYQRATKRLGQMICSVNKKKGVQNGKEETVTPTTA